MRIQLIGPQGCGKGTQAKLISKKFGIPHISSGEIFRDNIDNNTEIGNKAKAYVDKGILVPDNIVCEMILDRIQLDDCSEGFVLDGFPRNIDQAELLFSKVPLDKIIFISIPWEESVKRQKNRRVCPKCGKSYNLATYPKPKKDSQCDNCNVKLQRRSDATPQATKERKDWYENKTKPLINWYEDKGILTEVNGIGKVEEISKNIFNLLNTNL